ncbi:hypothetical protein DM02DRAFT_227928 [Periconia macrospinosa]|uniref:F-box domain-containing protein n=1 Tax=Periconia macrospinosa TaxID=97972 RepID=A0A2V1D5X4_9PLEO|nr:hypothetical protein DM02DRAFT_227928 [Periconia macrospinosa]
MPSLLDMPAELAEAIGLELLASDAPLEDIFNKVCILNSKAREIYQKMLFYDISLCDSNQMRRLARAIITNPSLAKEVKRMEVTFAPNSPTDRAYEEIFAKARTFEFFSRRWEMLLNKTSPFALCGLLIALLPQLTELKVTTQRMELVTGEDGWEDDQWCFGQSSPYDSRAMASAEDFFGAAALSCPEKISLPKKLRTWRSIGMVPFFVFQFWALETLEFDVGPWMENLRIDRHDIVPSHGLAFDTIKNLIIKSDAVRFSEDRHYYGDPHIRYLLEKLVQLQSIKFVIRQRGSQGKDNIKFTLLAKELTGPASSLIVELLPSLWHVPRADIQAAKELPNLCLTKHVELPEAMLVNSESELNYAPDTLFDEPRSATVFQMETLKITNATKDSSQLLLAILNHRSSRFSRLTHLVISYRHDGIKGAENRKMHSGLCMQLENTGLKVTQVFDVEPDWWDYFYNG